MAANFKNISNGVGLVPNAGSVVTTAGDIAYNSVSSSLEVFTSAVESITTTGNTQTLTNKSFSIGGSFTDFSVNNQNDSVNLFKITGAGFVGIGSPSPTNFFEVQGNISGSGQYVCAIGNANSSTLSNGLRITAGTSSSDFALNVRDATGTTTLFSVAGDGTIIAQNLSGTNTGDVSLTAVGSSPSANGASLSGQALTLQPADATHPGLITATTQTIAGDKTFTGNISFTGGSVLNPVYPTSTFTGSGTVDGLDVTNKTYVEVSGGISQLEGFANGKLGQLVIINVAQTSITILHNSSNFQNIICPSNGNFVVSPEGSVGFVFNGTVWKVVSKAV